MTSVSPHGTELVVLSKVPNDRDNEIVRQLPATDRYVSHKVLPENGATSRIEVTVKKID
jgi:hypothetical protein